MVAKEELTHLAQFGAKVYALLTFTKSWDSDTFQQIADMAAAHELDTSDRSQARQTCQEMLIDSSDVGDTAPSVQFLGHGAADHGTVLQAQVEAWIIARHDATESDSQDDREEASNRLIDTLLSYARITIK